MATADSISTQSEASSGLNVDRELTLLNNMTINELRDRYAAVFKETTTSRHREWLIRRIAWRMQANAFGGLSERALQRAKELANESDLRVTAPRPKPSKSPPAERTHTTKVKLSGDESRIPPPGTKLVRPYKGRTLEVTVEPDGFRFEGEIYKSLSAVAKHITGTHCNGFHFFRLGKNGGAK